jgi:hypothetical protein
MGLSFKQFQGGQSQHPVLTGKVVAGFVQSGRGELLSSIASIYQIRPFFADPQPRIEDRLRSLSVFSPLLAGQ